jgi:hypothetical protein
MVGGTISGRHLKLVFILYASHAFFFTVVPSLGAKLESHPKVVPPTNIDFFKSQGDRQPG